MHYMKTATLSSKYQIVIPKELRKQLQLKAGQKVRLQAKGNGDITIKINSGLDELVGSVPVGTWGTDPVASIRKQRDEWDD